MGGITPPRPLAAEDDRAGFDCGRESLNDWFLRHAWHNQQADVSRTSVICDTDGGLVVGFVSLCAAQIERGYLPRALRRNRPDPVPAILLGQLAVDRRFAGRGHGASLLLFALTTALRTSRHIGCFGVLTHPLDDGVRAFYARFGFRDLPLDPRRSMIALTSELLRYGPSDG